MAPPYYILGPPVVDCPPPPMLTSAPILPIALLQNCSLEYLATINPCLATIYKAIQDPNPSNLSPALRKAYNDDPLTTLKLIFFMRSWGQSGKEAFLKSACWLHRHHPRTLARNVRVLGQFGWFKELLEILHRVLEASIAKKERKMRKKRKGRVVRHEEEGKERVINEGNQPKDIARAKAGLDRYYKDWEYKCLHNRISALFAEFLKSDLRFLAVNEVGKISMAARFCPSLDSCYDKSTLICESIARKVFPREDYKEYKDVEEGHYAYRIRNRLYKQVLVPLRKILRESRGIFRGSTQLQDSDFFAIKAYVEPDEKKRFKHYLKAVGKYGNLNTNDNDAVLLPHQVFILMYKKYEAAELHWQNLVEYFSKNMKLRTCIAVCDISEEKSGTIMGEICVAMALLISETSSDPWRGKIFTFSEYPKLCKIKGDGLGPKSDFIRGLDNSSSVNFLKIYNRILQVAITEKLSNDRMVKKVFVFTTQDFDDSMVEKWVEYYREAWKLYRKKGYKTLPEIVFWVTKHYVESPMVINSPVDWHHRGVVVVTGCSRHLISMFLMGDYCSTKAYTQVEKQVEEDLTVLKLASEADDLIRSALCRDEFESLAAVD